VATKKNYTPTKEELLDILRRDREEDQRNPAVKELGYSSDGDMTLKTETPPRMIMTLVRMKLIEAARDPDRDESLIAIFIKEFDKRMVSLNRKGRLELLGAMQAIAESELERREIPIK
jgi:hypothetical protein